MRTCVINTIKNSIESVTNIKPDNDTYKFVSLDDVNKVVTHVDKLFKADEFGSPVNLITVDSLYELTVNPSENLINYYNGENLDNNIYSESIDELFRENPELASIGTKEQYSQYLDTIFPDSKVKDIVYHGTDTKFENFSDDFLGKKDPGYLGRGFYFWIGSNALKGAKHIAFAYLNRDIEPTDVIKAVINVTNLKEVARRDYSNTGKDLGDYDAVKEKPLRKNSTTQIVVKSASQIHRLGSKKDISGFREFVNKSMFDKELAQKIQDKLEKLYPEIKLNITNNPVWEQGDNILNQQEYNNQINYRLKAVDVLTSDKAKQIFEKGAKNNWSLDKILSELQIPKEQKQIILDKVDIINNTARVGTDYNLREEIITSLLADNSFVVEINTAKSIGTYSQYEESSDEENFTYNNIRYSIGADFDGEIYFKGNQEISKEEYFKDFKKAKNSNQGKPTQYYSNLTVPGGTNYTENEIATPDIIPNIKGHAQFSTDNGIGWFRNDDKIKLKNSEQRGFWNPETQQEEFFDDGELESNLKTRRILEIQSDLFQKGRKSEELIYSDQLDKKLESHKEQIKDINKRLKSGEYQGFEYPMPFNIFPKGLSTKEKFEYKKEIVQKEIEEIEASIDKEKYKVLNNKNQFLQLLNKDNNWVTFFIKSIIQDSAKKGYEKVLFPKGDTAAKIEGHQTLEEFKQQKEARIKNLEAEVKRLEESGKDKIEMSEQPLTGLKIIGRIDLGKSKSDLNNEIKQLKQEIADVESGRTKLSSIAGFYEETITNILKKQGYNPVEITDEYGNKWNEVQITPGVLSDILLQKNEANQIIGQANIKAMTVLVDAINQKQDTLPHEYAHHYIAWFRDTPIVQEAIKKWGSEEALVQSIGEQVVKQKGEAYNWWNKFIKWIMDKFNSLSKLRKEELTQILTDAFLTRQNLSTSNIQYQKVNSNPAEITDEYDNRYNDFRSSEKSTNLIEVIEDENSKPVYPGVLQKIANVDYIITKDGIEYNGKKLHELKLSDIPNAKLDEEIEYSEDYDYDSSMKTLFSKSSKKLNKISKFYSSLSSTNKAKLMDMGLPYTEKEMIKVYETSKFKSESEFIDHLEKCYL